MLQNPPDNRDLTPRDLYEPGSPLRIGCRTFVYEALKSGAIPSYRIGKKLFVPRHFRELLISEQLTDKGIKQEDAS